MWTLIYMWTTHVIKVEPLEKCAEFTRMQVCTMYKIVCLIQILLWFKFLCIPVCLLYTWLVSLPLKSLKWKTMLIPGFSQIIKTYASSGPQIVYMDACLVSYSVFIFCIPFIYVHRPLKQTLCIVLWVHTVLT